MSCSAAAHHVPVISAAQLLEWLRHVTHRVSKGSAGLATRCTSRSTPTQPRPDYVRFCRSSAAAARLTALSRGGVAVPYATRTIKGVSYAVFGATSGTYAAVYG